MTTLSFEELKAENAKNEIETENNQAVTEQGVLDEKNVNEEITDNADDEQKDSTEDGETNGTDLESWQQTGDETPKSDQTGFIPNAEAKKRRIENTELRGAAKEKDSEIELLQKKIADYEAGITPIQTQSAPQLAPRPKIEDFDYDEARFQQAQDDWNDERIEQKFNSMSQTRGQQQAQEQKQVEAQKQQQASLNDHYARAGKLVDSGAVNAERFKSADTNVRRAIDSVFAGQGDQMANSIIATLNSLGEGSEKVIYSLGVNNSKLNEFVGILQGDPSGLQMMAYLGKLHSEVQDPKKRRSNAPAPASKLNSDSATKGNNGSLQKRYSKAVNVQERLDLKRAARKAGEDVSNW